MSLADAHNKAIQETLNRLENQGLSTETTKRALDCTNELFHLLARFDPAAGRVALAIVVGTIDHYAQV